VLDITWRSAYASSQHRTNDSSKPEQFLIHTWFLQPPSPLRLMSDLVPLHNSPILTMVTLEKQLGLFKRSKPPFEHLLLLSIPFFVILSKSSMISFKG